MIVVPAPAGYLFLVLGKQEDGGPLVLTERLVVAWEIRGSRNIVEPVIFGEEQTGTWDSALELPDGRCIRDNGEVLPNRAAWLESSLGDFGESEAEERDWDEKQAIAEDLTT